MAMNMTIWRVRNEHLEQLAKRRLDQEARLQSWVAADPSLLGLDLCIVGCEVATPYGGRIDILGIDQEGDLAVIELKRDKTPREIIAQVLDYAAWVDELGHNDIDRIAQRCTGMSLGQAFAKHFETPLPETLNGSHQLVIVAADLDDSSERIAKYLASRHGININVVYFNIFEHEGHELLGRSWLMDPEVLEEQSETKKHTPWTGIWYVNIGEEHNRSWVDRRKYGFVSAGGGETWSRPLLKLKAGNRLLAYVKDHGYVGYGEVTTERVLAAEFVPAGQTKPLPELPLESPIRGDPPNNGNAEYAVGVRWLQSVPREEAKRFTGVFANQNVVCKLRDPETLKFLSKEFNIPTIDGGG